jgi:hypothetical protein
MKQVAWQGPHQTCKTSNSNYKKSNQEKKRKEER